MTLDDVKSSIKNHILNSISHKDLCTLCNIFAIPINTRRKINQKNVLDSIIVTNDLTLLHHISFMLNKSEREANAQINVQLQPVAQNFAQNVIRFAPPQPITTNFSLNLRLYCLSEELMKKSPIDLRSEIVSGVNPQNIFVPSYTKYPDGHFNAPSCPPTLMNGRMHMPNAQLPYTSRNTTIKPSPFYCCQVVLHPLSLLIPKPTPNICQQNRIMSKMQLNFILSNSARQLITANRIEINNKSIYKWQVLLRFGVYDPVKPFPPQSNDITSLSEYIPPYLSISVNGIPVQLWDILPSNTTIKEGKRHSRPINVTEFIKYMQVDDRGYRQIINVNWWQTPGVYLYYYAAVFLERKLDVNELLNQFVKKTHSVQRPITFTLDFIREKFSSNNQFTNRLHDNEDNDDDLIMSSVLPVSLLCPVGKSRITCPLRSISCQHLQCFDAHLYLMMNERRSVWKCPVCDCQATTNELFVDEYFLQILRDFGHDEEITEVNVNPDGTYVPVAIRESREERRQLGSNVANIEKPQESVAKEPVDVYDNSMENQPVILLESDDEQILPHTNHSSPCALVPFSSDAASVRVNESVNDSSTTKITENASCTIDLTSDSEDDAATVTMNDFSLLSMPLGSTNMKSFQNRLTLTNLTTQPIQPDPIKYSTPVIINTNSLKGHQFQRIPLNCPLLLPSNNISNMVWIQPNQNYPSYVFSKETPGKIIAQTIYANPHQSSSSNRQLPTIVTKTATPPPVPPVLLQAPPAIAATVAPIKPDPYHSENVQKYKERPSTSSSTMTTKSKKKKVSRQLTSKRSGSRHSSRIECQSRKKYFDSGSSDEDNGESDVSSLDVLVIKKRTNPFDDSESEHSGRSNIKRRRLIQPPSSDEETPIKDMIIKRIMSNLELPILCLTKLDEDVLNRYLKTNEKI